MRKLQKEYFKSRNSIILAKCKKLEKIIDDRIIEMKEPEKQENNLFTNQP